MARRTAWVRVIVFACASILAASASGQDRAQEVLTRAKQALGSEAALNSVTSLAVKATVRTVLTTAGREISSDVQVELLLPDKIRKSQVVSFGGISLEVITGLSGERVFVDDGGMSAAAGVDPLSGPRRATTLRNLRQENLRLQTVWLLSPPRGAPFTITYAGEAEAPDGKADVLDVSGPDAFSLRLFLDKRTHRLLMATFPVEIPAMDKTQIQEAAKKAAAENPNPRDAAKAHAELLQRAPRKTVSVQMRFSDYRKVDGIWCPHEMTIDMEGQSHEEWKVASYKLNPPLKPERFEKR